MTNNTGRSSWFYLFIHSFIYSIVIQTKLAQSQIKRYVNQKKVIKTFFLQHNKMSNLREIENPKVIENLEIVTERYEKLTEKN